MGNLERIRSTEAGEIQGQVVLGETVAQELPLQVLAGLEGQVIVNRGDFTDVVVKLIERNSYTATYYSGLEEFQAFAQVAKRAGITAIHRDVKERPVAQELAALISQILADRGYRPQAIESGLEELTRDLVFLGQEV